MSFQEIDETREKHLIFDSQITQYVDKKNRALNLSGKMHVWSNRIVLFEDKHNEQFWNFVAVDLWTNESHPIRFQKSGTKLYFTNIYSLDSEFGLFVESSSETYQYISLVKFNWDKNAFELIDHVKTEYKPFQLLIDKMNPSKFALKWRQDIYQYGYQIYEVDKGKINFVENYEFRMPYYFYCNNKFVLIFPTKVRIYNLILKKQDDLEIDQLLLPKDAFLLSFYTECVDDHLYVRVLLKNTGEETVAHADLETRRWAFMNFQTKFVIKELKFFGDNLILDVKYYVQNKDGEIVGHKFYNVPVKRPHSLRQSAWHLVVQIMKQKEKKNPYEEAKEFLPLNSDLQAPWFKNEEKIN